MPSGMVCKLCTEAVSSFYVSYEFSPQAALLKGIARQGTWFYLAISKIKSFSQNQDFLSWELFREWPFFWGQFQKRSYWDLGSHDSSVQANWFHPRESRAQNLLWGCRFILLSLYCITGTLQMIPKWDFGILELVVSSCFQVVRVDGSVHLPVQA